THGTRHLSDDSKRLDQMVEISEGRAGAEARPGSPGHGAPTFSVGLIAGDIGRASLDGADHMINQKRTSAKNYEIGSPVRQTTRLSTVHIRPRQDAVG